MTHLLHVVRNHQLRPTDARFSVNLGFDYDSGHAWSFFPSARGGSAAHEPRLGGRGPGAVGAAAGGRAAGAAARKPPVASPGGGWGGGWGESGGGGVRGGGSTLRQAAFHELSR